jgi:hypothetical protein
MIQTVEYNGALKGIQLWPIEGGFVILKINGTETHLSPRESDGLAKALLAARTEAILHDPEA